MHNAVKMFGLFGGGDKSGDKPEESLEKEWDMTGDSFGSSDAQLNDPYSSMEDPFADSADSFDDSTEHFVSAAGGVSDIYQDLHEPAQTTIRDTSEQRSTSSNQDDGPVDMSALFGINSNVLNAVNAQQSGEQDRFLSSKRKGLWETGMHNVGTTYLSGMYFNLQQFHAQIGDWHVVSRCACGIRCQRREHCFTPPLCRHGNRRCIRRL